MDALRAGASVSRACRYANVGESTFYQEQAANQEFADQVSRARERTVVRDLLVIQRSDDWRAAREHLKLIDPNEFGDRLNIRSEHRVEMVQVLVTVITEALDLLTADPQLSQLPISDRAVRLRLTEAIGSRGAALLGLGGDEEARPELPPGPPEQPS